MPKLQNSTEKIDLLNAKINVLSLSLNVMLFENKTTSLHELGETLCDENLEYLENGGIWLWNYDTSEVYYSKGFCNAFGFDYRGFGNGFDGFNTGDKNQMQHGYGMIKDLIERKSIEPFINYVTYGTKNDEHLSVQCVGSVFYKNDEPFLILGTHKIL